MRVEGVLSRTKSETYVELIFVEWLYETLLQMGAGYVFSGKILLDQI